MCHVKSSWNSERPGAGAVLLLLLLATRMLRDGGCWQAFQTVHDTLNVK